MEMIGKLCFLIPIYYVLIFCVVLYTLKIHDFQKMYTKHKLEFAVWRNQIKREKRIKEIHKEKLACVQVAVKCKIPIHLMKIIYDRNFNDIT